MLKTLMLGATLAAGVASLVDVANAAEACGPGWWRGNRRLLPSDGRGPRVSSRISSGPRRWALPPELKRSFRTRRSRLRLCRPFSVGRL